jgi:drug/metabolite transporter (DMT)-like permease
MTTSNLIRWSGLAAILSGVLAVASSGLSMIVETQSAALEAIYVIQAIPMLFGILGVYAYQHEECGWSGFLGFILAVIGNAFLLGGAGEVAGVPNFMLGGTLAGIGLLLLAIGSWKAGVFPSWMPMLWIVAILAGVPAMAVELNGQLALAQLLFLVSGVIFAVGFGGAGYVLWSGRAEPAGQVASVA